MPGHTIARSHPSQTQRDDAVQIEMRINEAARAWFDKAMGCRDNSNPPAPRPLPEFCVDVSLLDATRQQYTFRPQAFVYLRPDRMGYLPYPTTLICSECGLIEATETPRQMGQRLTELAEKCPHPKRRMTPKTALGDSST